LPASISGIGPQASHIEMSAWPSTIALMPPSREPFGTYRHSVMPSAGKNSAARY
jgi:hypothetical protein